MLLVRASKTGINSDMVCDGNMGKKYTENRANLGQENKNQGHALRQAHWVHRQESTGNSTKHSSRGRWRRRINRAGSRKSRKGDHGYSLHHGGILQQNEAVKEKKQG